MAERNGHATAKAKPRVLTRPSQHWLVKDTGDDNRR